MKKILIKIMLILISLIMPYNVNAISTTDAREKIDITKNCNLTLNYTYDDYIFNNINVKLYYIALVTTDFQYQLSSNFSKYPVKINGLTTNEEWNILKNTLNAYIIADNIEETQSHSIQNNILKISNLKPGLYFIKTEKIDTENYTLLFDLFLISIPNLSENGTWNYEVNVYPKAEEYIPNYQKITYTVVKQWVDDKKIRPQSIAIDIYKDGIWIDSQVLSSDNNWIYKFDSYNDGSEWTVVEKNIPTGYNVTILNKEKNFIIINTDSNYKEENPKTLDNINIYLYLFIGSFIGMILLIISLIMHTKRVK